MSSKTASLPALEFHPVTPDRWKDLEALFGKRGACGGCWCMWWRMKRSEFEKKKGEGNKRALKKIIDSGEIPSLLAYANGRPIGWCSIAPRETYPVLERSRTLKRVDDQPVWSVVCFFVAKPFGRGGHGEAAKSSRRMCEGTWCTDCRRISCRTEETPHARCLCLYWFGVHVPQNGICRSAPAVRDPANRALLYRRAVGGDRSISRRSR